MLDTITDLWHGAADVAVLIALGLYHAFVTMPLPVTLIIATAGLALGQAAAQYANRHDNDH